MGKYEREKGKRFEREIANRFKEEGFDTRRGQQFCGLNGDADVVGLPGIHIECKAVEKLNVYEAMEQSERDAREGEAPIVIQKRKYKDILVTMKFDDFVRLYKNGI